MAMLEPLLGPVEPHPTGCGSAAGGMMASDAKVG